MTNPFNYKSWDTRHLNVGQFNLYTYDGVIIADLDDDFTIAELEVVLAFAKSKENEV